MAAVDLAGVVAGHHAHIVSGIGNIGMVEVEVIHTTRVVAEEAAGVGGGVRQVAHRTASAVELALEGGVGGTDATRPSIQLERRVVSELEEEALAACRHGDGIDAGHIGGSGIEAGVGSVIVESIARINEVGEVGQLGIVFNDARHVAADIDNEVHIFGEAVKGGGEHSHTRLACFETGAVHSKGIAGLAPAHAISGGGGDRVVVDARDVIGRYRVTQHNGGRSHLGTSGVPECLGARIKAYYVCIGIIAQTCFDAFTQHFAGKFAFGHTCSIIAQ